MINKLQYYYNNSIRFDSCMVEDMVFFYYDKHLIRKMKLNKLMESKIPEILYETLKSNNIVFIYDKSTKKLSINNRFDDIKYGEYEDEDFDLEVSKLESTSIVSGVELYPNHILKQTQIFKL